MPRRKTLTENQVAKLPRRAKRYYLADPVQQGLVLRIPPQRPYRLFSAVAWRGGKQIVAGARVYRDPFPG